MNHDYLALVRQVENSDVPRLSDEAQCRVYCAMKGVPYHHHLIADLDALIYTQDVARADTLIKRLHLPTINVQEGLNILERDIRTWKLQCLCQEDNDNWSAELRNDGSRIRGTGPTAGRALASAVLQVRQQHLQAA